MILHGSMVTTNLPHRKPECIFDFEDGLRLIVSFDEFPDDDKVRLHVSASFPPDCPVCRAFMALPTAPVQYAYLCGLIMAAMPQLARRTVKLRFMQIDDRGAPHFVGPTREEWEAQT